MTCNKHAYPDRPSAETAARRARRFRDKRVHVYSCRICGAGCCAPYARRWSPAGVGGGAHSASRGRSTMGASADGAVMIRRKVADGGAVVTTFGSLFSGGGGADIGALQAGLTPLWAVEYEPDIAGVYRRNLGDRVTVGDIRNVNPADLPYVDILHASPPCPAFSVANPNRGETAADIEVAQVTADIIRHVAPRAVTIENVALYRHSESYRLILDTLHECGYWTAVDTVNFADYGVPQTRTRLIVRAVRGGWIPYLLPTHDKDGAQ